MQIFEKIWTFLNGKKTWIGGALGYIAGTIIVIAQIWNYDAWWVVPLAQTFTYFGLSIGGGGITHKVLKNGPGRTKGKKKNAKTGNS